jgi:predicted component of type VI protein secretion system
MDLGEAKLRVTVDASGAKQGASDANSAFQSMMEKALKALESIEKSSEETASGIEKLKESAEKSEQGFDALIEKGKQLIEVLGLIEIAHQFIEAGSEAENLRIRLNALVGDGTKALELFENLQKYAGSTAFGMKDVGNSALQLTGVFKGNVEAVQAWIPLIGDLASATGQTIDETTTEVIRMMTQGGNGAGAFRDRGLAAMLDLQRGVDYSAKDIRDKLIAAWEDPSSKFRDAAAQMGTTWTGTMNQLTHAWDEFMEAVMIKGGVLDYLKAIIQVLTKDFKDAFVESDTVAKSFGLNATSALADIGKGIGYVVESSRFLSLTWDALKTSISGIETVWARMEQAGAQLSARNSDIAVKAQQDTIQYMKDMGGVSDTDEAMIKAKADLRDLLVKETKAWQDASDATQNYEKTSESNQKTTDELFASYQKFQEGFDPQKFIDELNEQFQKNQDVIAGNIQKNKDFTSSLRDFAPPIDDSVAALKKLTQAKTELADLDNKLVGLDAQAQANINPVTAAYDKYTKAVGEAALIKQKEEALTRDYPALGLTEAGIVAKVTQTVNDLATARDNEIKKAQQEADVIGRFERQLLQDDSLDALTDKQKAVQEATNKVIDEYIKLSPALQALHPLTAEAIVDMRNFVAQQYDQKQSITQARQILTDYANSWKSGFDSMASDAAKFFTGQIKSWGDFGKALINDVSNMVTQIIAQFLELQFLNPILNSMFQGILNLPTYATAQFGMGQILGTLGSGAGTALGGGGSGAFAGSQAAGSLGGASALSSLGSLGQLGSLFGSNSLIGSGITSLFGSSAVGAGGTGAFAGATAGASQTGLLGTTGLGNAFGTYAPVLGGFMLGDKLGGTGGGIALAAASYFVPIIGWISGALSLIDKFTGGGLLGTDWKPTGTVTTGLNVGSSGASVQDWLNESKKGSLFSGRSWRNVSVDPTQDQTDAANAFFTGLQKAVATSAAQLGVKAGDLVTGSFTQITDKSGNITSQISTIMGKQYKETMQQFEERITAENLLALLPAASNAETIADKWRSSADTLYQGTQFLIDAQSDINKGMSAFGKDTTLADIDTTIEALNKDGETLDQTYQRVSADTQAFSALLDAAGIKFTKTGTALVTFSSQLADAAGGDQNLQQLMNTYTQAYYTPSELSTNQYTADKNTADSDISALGDAGAGLTFDNFRQRFEAVINTLSPQDVVNWLQAGDALAKVNADLQQTGGFTGDLSTDIQKYNKLFADYATAVKAASGTQATFTDQLVDNRNQILALAAAYDGSDASEKKLEAMIQNRYELELQYLQAIDAYTKQIDSDISSLITGIQTSQMTPDQKYAYYRNDANTASEQLKWTTDPDQINALVKRIEDDEQQAWDDLSPDQQNAMAQQFINFLQGVKDEADQQLGSAKQGAENDNQTISDAVNNALTKATDSMQTAADTQTAAAATFNQGVDLFVSTPIKIQVTTVRGSDVGGWQQ